MASSEWNIANCFRNGLISKLQLDPSQVRIAMVKPRDFVWIGKPSYLIVPGAAEDDGGGQGGQEGGDLLLVQKFSVHYYGQTKMDQHGMSNTALMDYTMGVFQAFENIKQVFAHTFFGTEDGSATWLIQPLYLLRFGQAQWEDENLGIFSRELVYAAHYGESLPDITLYLEDVANTPAI